MHDTEIFSVAGHKKEVISVAKDATQPANDLCVYSFIIIATPTTIATFNSFFIFFLTHSFHSFHVSDNEASLKYVYQQSY